ncbi:hypothetical protein CCR95_08585 [Thiocystis minor]|uniref:hypothetical protein n=1 Tax=Thiocystis minor TaxID=61597 RepID=UPI00191276A0|nr:hypothetical protein [Thiocystis minor]MBK5964139.1 hypothetical protein [Thiocystis minor]
MSHDQNFKNLILDYPREAIQFAAAAEAAAIDQGARILPIRQEQLKERLGARFRELDTPLLVEWPDGRREALLFVFEEETKPRRFSIHRLAHYCLDLAELIGTERVVPVVIFLHSGAYPTQLILGGDHQHYLEFRYLTCPLFSTPARQHFDSPNLVARLNLPNMAYVPEDKLDVYAQAVRGLLELEPDPERQIKYLDFIDIYTHLTENERVIYQQRYAPEADAMSGFAERFMQIGEKKGHQEGLQEGLREGLQEGLQEGHQEGLQEGEAKILLHLLTLKFGPPSEAVRARVQAADPDTLLAWSARVLTASGPDEVFAERDGR